jgi:hypothetical protein
MVRLVSYGVKECRHAVIDQMSGTKRSQTRKGRKNNTITEYVLQFVCFELVEPPQVPDR